MYTVCYTCPAVKDIVTVQEAARFLRKHPDTIRRFIEQKKLRARHLSAGGHGIYAILRSDLLEFAVSDELRRKERITRTPKKPVPDPQRQLPL